MRVGWVSPGLRELCCSPQGLECLGHPHAEQARTLLQALAAAAHLSDLHTLRAVHLRITGARGPHRPASVAIQHREITLTSTPWTRGAAQDLDPQASPVDLSAVAALRVDELHVAGVDALRWVS